MIVVAINRDSWWVYEAALVDQLILEWSKRAKNWQLTSRTNSIHTLTRLLPSNSQSNPRPTLLHPSIKDCIFEDNYLEKSIKLCSSFFMTCNLQVNGNLEGGLWPLGHKGMSKDFLQPLHNLNTKIQTSDNLGKKTIKKN